MTARLIRPARTPMDHDLQPVPLSALLSQLIVAYTVEADNEFEIRMAAAGIPGARLSLTSWQGLLRLVPTDGCTVGALTARAGLSQARIRHHLGCLERWGFLTIGDADADRHGATRAGFGSGRGLRQSTLIAPSAWGLRAQRLWREVVPELEQRWQRRWSKRTIRALKRSLATVLGDRHANLPLALALGGDDDAEDAHQGRHAHAEADDSLPALLGQTLVLCEGLFNQQAAAPLSLSANLLRVLSRRPLPEGLVPMLTGGSPETAGVGWRARPYVVVAADPSQARGRVLSLSDAGLSAQRSYQDLSAEVESHLRRSRGDALLTRLRAQLEHLLSGPAAALRLREGLTPADGCARAGALVPALGRRTVAAASRQRTRDLQVQTEYWREDPTQRLPHFPLWDANRGFGP